MATLDSVSHLDSALKPMVARLVWECFDLTKDMSFKFRVGPVPVSVKVSKIEPLVEMWVGPRPFV